MGTRRSTTFLLAVTGLTLATVTAPSATAADRSPSSIAAAYEQWESAVDAADCDGADVAALYTPRSILLATFKTYVQGRAAITKYFDDLSCNPNLDVTTGRITTGRMGSMGYATGLYTFSYDAANGSRTVVPARFTFVFELRDGRWMIVNHHSSQDPTEH